MAYYANKNASSSIFDVFTLNPMPYHVLLFLGLIFFFIGIQLYFKYDDVVQTTETNLGWFLFAVPLFILLAALLVSNLEGFFVSSPYDRQRNLQSEGGSPWGVAAIIVLVLIMVHYQSTFLNSWFG